MPYIDTDTSIEIRVPGVDQSSCDSSANVDYPTVNFSHKDLKSLYGSAHDHTSWIPTNATTPNESGQFTVTGVGKLELEIDCNFEQLLNDVPKQCFPVGMPGVPWIYWFKRHDIWAAFNGLPRADNGEPYIIPPEGLWCWLGWPNLRFSFNAPADKKLGVKLTARKYKFYDIHVTGYRRQTTFKWELAEEEDREYVYNLEVKAGVNHSYICLPTPITRSATPRTWTPVGEYEYGRIDVYEGVDVWGECDRFAQRLWEDIYNASFPVNWWAMLTIEGMKEYAPEGSEWVDPTPGAVPSSSDIVFIRWYDNGNIIGSHVTVMHKAIEEGWQFAESNTIGDETGFFTLFTVDENFDGYYTGKSHIIFNGAGTPAWDGIYAKQEYGTYNGKSVYQKSPTRTYWYSGERWVISPTPGDPEMNWAYQGPISEDPGEGPWEEVMADPPGPEILRFRGKIAGWIHWTEGVPIPEMPELERVVKVEITGFSEGEWQLTDDPRLSLDPELESNEQVEVKAFEGYEYQKGGLSACVACAYLKTIFAGDDWNKNIVEATLPFFDRLIGYETGYDFTSAISIATYVTIITDCCDAWQAIMNISELDKMTKDNEDNVLSILWCFDICSLEGAAIPLEQDGHTSLNTSLRCGAWSIVPGLVYTVRPDKVVDGRGQGLNLKRIGELARDRHNIVQVWRRQQRIGEWEKHGDPVSSNKAGLWRTHSLPEVYRYVWIETLFTLGHWVPEFYEYAITETGAGSVRSVDILGRAPQREYIYGFIIGVLVKRVHAAISPINQHVVVVSGNSVDYIYSNVPNAYWVGENNFNAEIPKEIDIDADAACVLLLGNEPVTVLYSKDAGVYKKFSPDFGANWSEEMLLIEGAKYPMACTRGTGEAIHLVVWKDGGIKYYRSSDRLESAEYIADIASVDECQASIVISDGLYVVYHDGEDTNCLMSTDGGKTWN